MKSTTSFGRSIMLVMAFLAAAGVYVASYFALMEPRVGVGKGANGIVCRELHLTYRCGESIPEFLFAPLAALDKRLRPDYWRL